MTELWLHEELRIPVTDFAKELYVVITKLPAKKINKIATVPKNRKRVLPNILRKNQNFKSAKLLNIETNTNSDKLSSKGQTNFTSAIKTYKSKYAKAPVQGSPEEDLSVSETSFEDYDNVRESTPELLTRRVTKTRKRKSKSNTSQKQKLMSPKKCKPSVKNDETNTNETTSREEQHDGYKNPFVYDHLPCEIPSGSDEENDANSDEATVNNTAGLEKVSENIPQQSEDNFSLKCEHCETVFEDSTEYTDHLKYSSNGKLLKCHICTYSTKYNCALAKHLVIHKDESEYDEEEKPAVKLEYGISKKNTIAKNKKIKIRPEKEKTDKTWLCLFCNKNFEMKTELIEHYSTHMEKGNMSNYNVEKAEKLFQCDICLKEFELETALQEHLDAHKDYKFTCEYCSRCFKLPYSYTLHLNSHLNEKEIKCYLCDYRTANHTSLKKHLKVHEADYKYKCGICGRGYNVYTWFEEHKNFHTGAKPFSCSICEEKFSYSRDLLVHKRTAKHMEAKPTVSTINECEKCKIMFPNQKLLTLHLKRHKEQAPVICDICGKLLTAVRSLAKHKRTHTGYKPYACSVCGRKFASGSNLKLHERIHTGEKPYKCPVCGRDFARRGTLLVHSRYHTGERPYPCHLCDRAFVSKGVLIIHLRRCNGGIVNDSSSE